MKIVYEIKSKEAVVWRCYDYGTEAELPEMIESCPVTELAPYAFSAHMDERLLEKGFREGRLRLWDPDSAGEDCRKSLEGRQVLFSKAGTEAGLPPALTGAEVEEVNLPPALRKIGAYAFYNCSRLWKLSFYGGLSDLGAGLFTGCHGIRELVLHLDDTQTSCLREILMEVPEKLKVSLDGSLRAKLVFPEFFEESVENTPARILVTHIHGSGMNYRNCFYDRKFDFRAYDSCFYHARAEENFDTVLEMALARLRYPVQLSKESRAEYESWLELYGAQAVKKAVSDRDMEILEYLTCQVLARKKKEEQTQILREASSLAVSCDFPEGVSFLMDALHGRDGEQQKEGPAEAGQPRKPAGGKETAARRFEL